MDVLEADSVGSCGYLLKSFPCSDCVEINNYPCTILLCLSIFPKFMTKFI